MLRFIVPDDPLQNSSFHDTWLCQKKMYKNTITGCQDTRVLTAKKDHNML